MSTPRVSVVIRAKNEAPSIGRTLDLLASQTVAADTQIIVVDSGSTDGTVDIVRGRAGVELIEIPAASFTYGGSLNTGAERAAAPIVVALSAHSFPKDDGWLARMLDAMADENVACASGQGIDAHGRPIDGIVRQDLSLAHAHPFWGYSSHAGGFRADLWREYPFRTDMGANEDKEWCWHWLARGRVAALGPGLTVDHSHGRDPLREQYDRSLREWEWAGEYTDVEPQTPLGVIREWWTDLEKYPNHRRARLAPRRFARLAGAYRGRRAAHRRAQARRAGVS
ncbi:MAG: glycosyltransferase family 2 protein [Solirubrobacteraceae bacterium]